MSGPPLLSEHRSAAWPLSVVAVALVVYATLYPLSDWQWPNWQTVGWLLPKHRHEVANDIVGNILGYLPLGLVVCLAHLRSGRSVPAAVALTLLPLSMLSYALELAQFALPMRVPSMTDWLLNSLGAAWGTLAAVTVHMLGMVDGWHRLRERWFIPEAGLGLVLVWVWPLGLLFPPPLPFGQGQLWPHLQMAWVDWMAGTPWQDWLLPADPLVLWAGSAVQWLTPTWAVQIETFTVMAGLLAPICVVCVVTRAPRTRLLLGAVTLLAGIAASTLSTALNYGPQHAFTWVTLPTSVGLLLGATAGMLLLKRSRFVCALLGMGVLTMLVALIHLAPIDPYYAQTLQAWEQGRFIRFHGLARWFGILWPYVVLAWLFAQLWLRETPRSPSKMST